MPYQHPSGQPHWDNPSGRGLPAIPPPERESAPSSGEELVHQAPAQAAQQARPTVAEWLGWSPTSWRARGAR